MNKYKKNIYRVSYFNFYIEIPQNVQKIRKNVLNKSCRVQKGI